MESAIRRALWAGLALTLCVVTPLAHAEPSETDEPTVVDMPDNFGGLGANLFYWMGGILLVGAIALVLVTAWRHRR